MAIYPDGTGLKPIVPHESGPIENVRRNEAEDGSSQSRDLWGTTRFYAVPEYELADAKAEEWWDFWRNNRATTFTYYDFTKEKFSNEVIGTGDGSNLTFTIPAKETGGALDGSWSRTVEVNDGVASTAVTAGGTGYASSFAVTYTGGGGSGAAGTATAVGGVIQSVTMTNPGKNYSSAPTPVFTAGGGTGGAGTTTIGAWVTRTVVTEYNVTSGTGALGEDRVVLTGGNAPPNTRSVRITYRGRHRYTCEWDGTPTKTTITGSGRTRISARVRQAFGV